MLFACCSTTWAATVEVGINQVRNRSTYMLDLMKLALTYTTDTNYVFVETDERLSKNAEHEATLSGKIGVYWGGTSEDQERDFIPIHVDGYRGLMSLRFFIIRDGDQSRFSAIRTLDDLQRIKMGQGRSWRDAEILEASGIKVERATKKDGLFYMLEGGRFDAFPRGATEAWDEANGYRHLNLAVEKKLIVSYPLPTYFFVHKGYDKLARDIHYGLNRALQDGSFDRFFYTNDRVQAFLAEAKLEDRHVIELDNPFLPASAKIVEDAGYNLSIEQLIEGARRLKNGEFSSNFSASSN